jgi:hypothetical protein
MQLHIHHHHDPALILIQQKLEQIMSALDDLATAVAAEDTVIDSAILLINSIPALIAAAGTDPTKLAALQADIKAHAASLSAAVVANTPAVTPPAAPPAVPPAG